MIKRLKYEINSENFQCDTPGEEFFAYSAKERYVPHSIPLYIDGRHVGSIQAGQRLYIVFGDDGLIDSWYLENV